MSWQPFDAGSTLGDRGSEDGLIVRDEEHPLGARITLEEGCTNAPLAITCGIYGWMVHTRFSGDTLEAERDLAAMKNALDRILEALSSTDAATDDPRTEANRLIEDFVRTFP